MKSLKYVGVCIGAALLCGGMQAATLKEIEAQKKAEQAKMEQKLKNVAKSKYGVVYDDNVLMAMPSKIIISELKKDIPAKQKDWIMKLIAMHNEDNQYIEKELKGHMIPDSTIGGISNDLISVCREATEAYAKKDKSIRESNRYFTSKHYYADKCILMGVYDISSKYSSIYDKDQYDEYEIKNFSQEKYDEKKAFVQWLEDIKFYDYIGGLSVEKNKANDIMRNIETIQKNLSFKNPYKNR